MQAANTCLAGRTLGLSADIRANDNVGIGLAASHDDEPLFGPGLRTLEVWIAPLPRNPRYLMLGSAMGAVSALAVQHRVHLLTDEDGDGDLSAPH